MFNKRKRSTRRWSVRAIEFMIVFVAMMATATILFPQSQPQAIRVVEVVQEPVQSTVDNELVTASYDAALNYMYQKDYQNSANLLEAITNVAQDHYWSHVTYSFVLYEQGQYEEAMQLATEGIRIDPNDPVAWNNRCLLRALTGNLQGGLSDCNKSIAVDATYDYSFNNRCFVLMRLGRANEAERDCMQALENGHRMPEWVYTNLGHIALSRGLPEVAEDHYRSALEHNMMHAEAYAGLGDALLIQADYNKALKFYQTYRDYAGVHYNEAYDAKIDYVVEAITNLGQN